MSGALFLMPRGRSDPPPPLRARVTCGTCLLIIFMKYAPCYFFINAQRMAQVQGQGRKPQEAVIMQTAAAYYTTAHSMCAREYSREDSEIFLRRQEERREAARREEEKNFQLLVSEHGSVDAAKAFLASQAKAKEEAARKAREEAEEAARKKREEEKAEEAARKETARIARVEAAVQARAESKSTVVIPPTPLPPTAAPTMNHITDLFFTAARFFLRCATCAC